MHKFLHTSDLEEFTTDKADLTGVRIFKALDASDAAGFSLDVVEFEAGQRSPTVFHRGSAEMVYVLTGEADFIIDGERRRCGPGSIIYFQANTTHVIETGDQPVRFLAITSPPVEFGGDIHFLDEAGAG